MHFYYLKNVKMFVKAAITMYHAQTVDYKIIDKEINVIV